MNRYIDREMYFLELAETSKLYYLGYIKKYKSVNSQSRILEIGCGEGGNLLPFAEIECFVEGIDISRNKIDNAIAFFKKRKAGGVFYCEDFLTTAVFDGQELFDIVIIHDVIEHIEPNKKADFFLRLKNLLKKDAVVFWGFPAWQMPFGGHQQICKSRMSRIPFIHLLPNGIYERYLRMFGESEECVNELISIKKSRMTVESFEALCMAGGYKILDRTLWLVSPHYKVKFNLTPRRLCNCIGRIPYLRNYFSTACFYIVSV